MTVIHLIACAITTALLAAGPAASQIKSDETVVFFPTWACSEGDGRHWVIPIHGWIFEDEPNSVSRAVFLELLSEAIDLDEDSRASAVFNRHARPFIVDNERGKTIRIRLGNQTYATGESGPNGHFEGTVRLPAAEVQSLLKPEPAGQRWLHFEAVMPEGDHRSFAGSVQLLDPTGLSVVSDIDDTIRVSFVTNTEAVLASTFLREFQAVEGMAAVYQRWAAAGASFHYVSSSPWQLYGLLSDFMARHRFPKGSFALKAFRLKDSTLLDLLADPQETKPKAIEPLLSRFPQRKFILVGDSGEKDPEVYGHLARKYPD